MLRHRRPGNASWDERQWLHSVGFDGARLGVFRRFTKLQNKVAADTP
jgi:hypothetical protein